MQEVIVRGELGYAVMMSATSGTLLLCVSNQRAKLGLIFFDMRRTIDELGQVL